MKRALIFFAGGLVGLVLSDPVAIKVQGPDGIGNPIPMATIPPGVTGSQQTQLTGSANGANTALTATLTGAASKTTYISGFEVTGDGATAGSTLTVTVTGTVGGTLNYTLAVPTGVTNSAQLIVEFPIPIASSAVNTNIVVNVPAFGTGNVGQSVTAHGFLQ
jgi:hypothetical protein